MSVADDVLRKLKEGVPKEKVDEAYRYAKRLDSLSRGTDSERLQALEEGMELIRSGMTALIMDIMQLNQKVDALAEFARKQFMRESGAENMTCQ